MKVAACVPSLSMILAWLRVIFGRTRVRHEPEPAAEAPTTQIPEIADAAQPVVPEAHSKAKLQPPKRAKPRRTATQTRPDSDTFADLLNNLNDSFVTMSIPEIKGNWLSRKEIVALQKLGVFIPTPWRLELVKEPSLPADMALPSIASCHLINSKYDTDDKAYARFAFAIREPRLPPRVERIPGTPYRFGACFQIPEKQRDKGAPRMFWMWAWVVVRPDGSLAVAREWRPVEHVIRHRRAQGGSRLSTFVRHEWMVPSAFRLNEEQDPSTHQNFLLCVFRQLLMWWVRRAERWSVGVRKDGNRATFSIAPEHTSAYFADRDIKVTANGATKKIIHFVRAHRRANGSMVRQHVRGLREFDWRGYHCAVTAPKLNGAIYTNLHLPPVEASPDDNTDKWLDLEQVAARLSNAEDFSILTSAA